MSSGRPLRAPKIVALVLIWGLFLACTETPERIPVEEPIAAPTASPADTPVAESSPTVVEPTPVPSLADDDTASVTTVDAGTTLEDPAGNLIAVHGLGTIPADVLALADLDLFADTETLLDASLGFLDVSWCTAGAIDPSAAPIGDEIALSVVTDTEARLGPPGLVPVRLPLRGPGFAVPEPGSCSRGWAAVELDGEPAVARLIVVDPRSSDSVPDVLQWELPPAVALDAEALDDEAFGRGQVVVFNEGALAGTTVTVRGWAELIGVESPVPDTRQVGVLVEVCPANEDWPELGLAVDGWNLLAPFDLADRLGADPLAPLSGKCFEDWAEFAVPLGFAPSGFFVSDGIDADVGFAGWSLDGAAIAAPS